MERLTASVPIDVAHFTDPGCPWAWSASPAHAVLRWRYGDALRWRPVMIGLTERAEQYVARGYTPAGQALGYMRFRRYGMPFAAAPRRRIGATGRACRAVVATRLLDPPRRKVEVAGRQPMPAVDVDDLFDLEGTLGMMERNIGGVTLSLVRQGEKQTKVKLRFDKVYYPSQVQEFYRMVWAAVDKQIFLDQALD